MKPRVHMLEIGRQTGREADRQIDMTGHNVKDQV